MTRHLVFAGAVALLGCSSTTSGIGSVDDADAGPEAGAGASAGGGGGALPGGGSGGAPSGGGAGATPGGGTGGAPAGGAGGSAGQGGSGGARADGGGACEPACNGDRICDLGASSCVCGSGLVETTDGACVADPCVGGASTVCGANMDCTAGGDGQAVCACASGYTDCSGACVDLQTDAAHCGACDYACAGTLTCTAGACDQGVVELVVGFGRTCALLADPDGSGTYPVRCWGDPARQFFRGTPTDPTLPSPVEGVSRVRGMAIGDNRFCVIDPTVDKVSCWGDCVAECNPDIMNSATFVDEIHGGGVSQITLANGLVQNRAATCSVSPSGQLLCWGYSGMIFDSIDRTSPFFIDVEGQNVSHSEVRGGKSHFCSRTFTGKVACWGDAFYGYAQWGIPEPTAGSEPTDAQYAELESGADLSDISTIGVGPSATCAVSATHELYCWGDNAGAQLGLGDEVAHVGAVKSNLTDVAAVSVGAGFACAVQRSGQLYCWGSRFQVGLGPTAQGDLSSGNVFSTPQAVPGMTDIVEVKASWAHVCARRRSGEVLCWGSNDAGELGDGTQIQKMSPTAVQSLL